jgi:hypothetical protein
MQPHQESAGRNVKQTIRINGTTGDLDITQNEESYGNAEQAKRGADYSQPANGSEQRSGTLLQQSRRDCQ